MKPAIALAVLSLTGCGSADQPSAPAVTPTARVAEKLAVPPPMPAITAASKAEDVAALDSRDCRTVAQAYADAISGLDYVFAARVWSDPTVDAARLKNRFAAYRQPEIAIEEVAVEGAAGSSYCTVGGDLTDAGNPATPAQKGQLELKRVNDVPGATPEQLRWTIRSSTFADSPSPTP